MKINEPRYSDLYVTLILIFGNLVGACITLSLMSIFGHDFKSGYRTAYEDMKKGTIESVMKKDYPKVWIKYNTGDKTK